jgi:hypothetical protein
LVDFIVVLFDPQYSLFFIECFLRHQSGSGGVQVRRSPALLESQRKINLKNTHSNARKVKAYHNSGTSVVQKDGDDYTTMPHQRHDGQQRNKKRKKKPKGELYNDGHQMQVRPGWEKEKKSRIARKKEKPEDDDGCTRTAHDVHTPT